ncbi:unnamed protein product, partial [Rotaria sp. Silwood1]
ITPYDDREHYGKRYMSDIQSNISTKSLGIQPRSSTKKIKLNNNKNQYEQPCTIIFLFAIAAMAISIYLLIHVMETTKTTSTTTTSTQLRWNSTSSTIVGITSSSGSASNQLYTPYHLTLDSNGSLYVADSDNHRVQKYLKSASTGTTVAGKNATATTALDNLYYPTGIIVDSSMNIYIADTNNNQVMFWSNGASSGTQIAGSNQLY